MTGLRDRVGTPPQWADLGVLDVVEPAWHLPNADRSGGSDAALLALAAHRWGHPPPTPAWVVGTSEGAASAEALGVGIGGVTPPVGGALRLLRRTGRGGPPAPQRTARLWGTAHTATAGRGCRVEMRAFGAPSGEAARLARGLAAEVAVLTEGDRLAWGDAGVGARVVPLPDLTGLAGPIRAQGSAVRAGLDLGESRLVVPVAERASDIDGRQFGFVLALLAVTNRPVAGLLAKQARLALLARRHLDGLMGPSRMFEVALSPLVVMGAADLALLPPSVREGSGAEAVIRAWGAALGVPVVRWGQRAPGKLRHTPALAWPVFEALDELEAARAIAGAHEPAWVASS